MKQLRPHLYVAIAAAVWAAAPALAATVDFESVPVGTRWGVAEGNVPGEVVLTQDGILMSVETFHLGAFEGFIYAEVGGQYDDFFPTTPLETNNISVRFDFSDLNFDVNLVTLEFMEFGGADNFAVNDHTIYELASLMEIPTDVAPGVIAFVAGETITLLGAIQSFQIGGQELAIDNVMAVPEPATALLLALGGLVAVRRRPIARG